ncbi:Multiple RNA-binding domain-containing protein 1 [Coemansia pectinata]|uniref:Multiple RNA-binding domain-containing protein 1 n=1 Tax=Coemansia pectinata TaxID=1052879 RepID=A0A9W8GSS4_9FUNG|nr:Multiple RNA-binding domain-containing protein 1 [Coemansia pectinata]
MSSRIVVKNLPKHITEERFRGHFSGKGEVTDAKLMYTERGQFRRFGFVGYRSEDEALAAQQYFNNSFIDTSKVSVEIAKPFGDASLPRAWSVYTKGTTLYNQVHGVRQETHGLVEEKKGKSQKAIRTLYEELLADNQDDPRFKEFLQVMAPRANNKTWTNDDYSEWHTTEQAAVNSAVAARREQLESKATPAMSAKSASKKTAASAVDAEPTDGQDSGSGLSDMEWLRKHMSSKVDIDDIDGDNDAGMNDEEPTRTGGEDAAGQDGSEAAGSTTDLAVEVASIVSQIQDTGRLFIRNLPYLATEEDLRAAFEKFGPLSEVHMPISKDTKRPKGFAYVLYLLPEHAVSAYRAMDNRVFLGRLLHVLPGKEKPQEREAGDLLAGFKSDVKKERDAKKKALAGSDFNWNSLYMSADAVADSISERLSISKADLLSADSGGNPAVRLALAETHIINDTKRFFEEQGVMLERFSHRERSDTVILVKNIPYSVDEDELRSLFGKFGSLGRVLLPPSRTIAIVELLEASEARAAFRHLAYKRLKDAPIYLERAPKDIFDTAFDPATEATRREHSKASEAAKAEISKMHEPLNDPTTTSVAATQGSTGSVAGCVLFVKNLDFDTTEDTLRSVFDGVDGLASVTIRRKKDPKRANKWLSMGFGFVEYKSPEAARQALESFQGIEVDDHALEIKISDRLAKTEATADSNAEGKKPKSTKLVVKNIPFEATKKDIRDLVSAFGQTKSVRLPSKFSGGHRGFAFVEFLTPQEAQHVLDTMKDTHLYGRHLVIDWAEEENSLQAIREKVGRQFAKDAGDNPATAGKRRKIEAELGRGGDNDDMDSDSD